MRGYDLKEKRLKTHLVLLTDLISGGNKRYVFITAAGSYVFSHELHPREDHSQIAQAFC